jgi:hypothetical protein
MRPIKGFWRALRSIPGAAASRLQWQDLLGEEWSNVGPLLRPAGAVVARVPCPSPGGDGCPRRVVNHGDDRIVAVCGDPEGQCESVELALEDIVVHELDVGGLASALCRLLNCEPDLRPLPFVSSTWSIGWYEPLAGKRFPISLALPTTEEEAHSAAVRLVGHLGQRFILFAPAREPIEPETIEYLRSHRASLLFLEDMLTVGAAGSWQLQRSAEKVLSDFRSGVLDDPRLSVPAHTFATPPGTQWQDVTIRFLNHHQVHVQVGRTSDVLHFTQMGMADGRRNPVEPNKQWTLLVDFAEGGGIVRWRTTHENRRRQKHKEELSKVLRPFFGIEGDPFEPLEDRSGWRARIRILPEQ